MQHQAAREQRSQRGAMSHAAGMAAEGQIEADYVRRGFSPAHRRWRGKGGEIDLVMRSGDNVIFVEVKQSRSFDDALQSLTDRQVTRLYAAAEEFLASEPRGSLTDVRFDVALVRQSGEYRIIENAFA